MRVAGEDLAVFRTREGALGAMIDQCPHRGAALSLGRVTEDGRLECPFHGWQFDTQGACARVPLCDLGEEKRSRLGVPGLPVREVAGLVWVFTGLDAKGTEPEPAPALVEDGWVRWIYAETWATHWTRAMENMLDVPHVPFVHAGTIGKRLRPKAFSDAVMHARAVPEPYGMHIEAEIDGERTLGGLEWRKPNGMVLHLDFGSRRMRQHIFCVPVDDEHTRMLLVSTRDFGRYNPVLALFDRFNKRILSEDRDVVESIRPSEVPDPAEEKSVATDGPTLYFRRYYLRELRGPRPDVPKPDVPKPDVSVEALRKTA